MRLEDVLVDYFFSKELEPTSARWYKQKLTEFVSWLEAHHNVREAGALRPALVSAFLKDMRGRPSPHLDSRPLSSQTVHGYARAIRAWLRWGVKQGWYAAEDLGRWDMPKRDKFLIKTFSPQDLQRLLLACARQTNQELVERDRAILHVLVDTGIRASELCGLTLSQVHLDFSDGYLIVVGKGRKERVTGNLGRRTRAQLHKYMRHFRHPREGVQAVFLGDDGRGLSRVGLDHMLKRLRDRAAVSGVRVSAHTFRHTYAANYLARGGDVYRLKQLLGHESVTTTEVYLRDFQARFARNGPSVADALFGD